MVERRVGKERIAECLECVSRSEFYIRAAQRPPPFGKHATELLLEYQFTKFFKSIETDIMKVFRPIDGSDILTNLPSSSEVVVGSYKKLIKQQDETIAKLMQEVKSLKESLNTVQLL